MRDKALAISIIFLLTLSSICFMATVTPVSAKAGNGDYITKFTIADANTGTTIYERDFTRNTVSGTFTVTNGESIKVILTVKIAVSSPSSTLTMSTDMSKMSGKDHYWEKQSGSVEISNPNSQSFTFAQKSGTFVLVCYGKASSSEVTKKISDELTIHNSVPINLILLKDSGKTTLDSITPKITDNVINDFNNRMAEKRETLANLKGSGVDAGFLDIYTKVLNQAQAAADAGLADNAVAMLKSLDGLSPPTASSMMIVLALVAVFAVMAALFGLMYFRNRGKAGYIKMMVEDQIKDLEGASMRAQRIDRNMAANLASIKQRLESAVGNSEESEGYDQGGYR
jgi:hypothetical protein